MRVCECAPAGNPAQEGFSLLLYAYLCTCACSSLVL
jgi:hypothetical protein